VEHRASTQAQPAQPRAPAGGPSRYIALWPYGSPSWRSSSFLTRTLANQGSAGPSPASAEAPPLLLMLPCAGWGGAAPNDARHSDGAGACAVAARARQRAGQSARCTSPCAQPGMLQAKRDAACAHGWACAACCQQQARRCAPRTASPVRPACLRAPCAAALGIRQGGPSKDASTGTQVGHSLSQRTVLDRVNHRLGCPE